VDSDVLVRHRLVDDCVHSRIVRQLSKNSQEYTASNPCVVADIGCGDGLFTNNIIEHIIINQLNITHVTKYLIDPFGNRDQNKVLTLSDKEFSDAFPSNHCDIIICKSVSHFFNNFHYWLNNCCRILKPEGSLYLLNMSSEIDFKEQWGQYAQQMFDLSLINESHEWVARDGELPDFRGNNGNYGCSVKHHKFAELVTLEKAVWRKFVENRSWSTLQSLTDRALKETLRHVDEKYKNARTVELDLKWTLSVVTKHKDAEDRFKKAKL